MLLFHLAVKYKSWMNDRETLKGKKKTYFVKKNELLKEVLH